MTVQLKTLADFKRATTVGTAVKTLSLATGCKEGRLFVGQIRFVKKADTTGIYLSEALAEGRGSFLGFDKAGDWKFDGDKAFNTKQGYSYQIGEGVDE